MTGELEPAAQVIQDSQDSVPKCDILVDYYGSMATSSLEDGEDLFASKDILQNIDERIDQLSEEIEEIEDKIASSDSGLSLEDGNKLRKHKVERIEELKNVKLMFGSQEAEEE